MCGFYKSDKRVETAKLLNSSPDKILLLGVWMIWGKDTLTRFEVARLLGARSLQVALGAPVLVATETTGSTDVARAEFKDKIIPITVKRKFPNGSEVTVDVKKGIENWVAEHKGEI